MKMKAILAIFVMIIVVFVVVAMASAQDQYTKETGVWKKADIQKIVTRIQSGELKNPKGRPLSVMFFNSGDRFAVTTSTLIKGKQEPALHGGNDEIMVVLAGSGRVTLGGVIQNAAPEDGYKWAEVKGTGIKGGTTFEVAEGDWFCVPRGTPHSMDASTGYIIYNVVKVPYFLPYVRKMSEEPIK